MTNKTVKDKIGFVYGKYINTPESSSINSFGEVNSIDLKKVVDKTGSGILVDITDEGKDSFAIYKYNAKKGANEFLRLTGTVTEGSTTTEKTQTITIASKETDSAKNITPSSLPCTNLQTTHASYALLRANPKLTGNIKVVVDSNSNMFLDTFKTNVTLSKEKYRKIPISYKDYYGNNVMSAFRLVSSDDIYDVPQKHHALFSVVSDYRNQYVDTYRYGAQLNTDKLYSENFSLLAPLVINRDLPDFFVVFKYNGVTRSNMSSTDIAKTLLKLGTQVAFFDFREGTKLGTYIRKIQREAQNVVGNIYVSKNENYTNMYTGISVDKGTVSNVYESVSRDDSETQVAMNNFYTKAYERNRLVSPNIVNFEFMFDDNEGSQYEINTYYGLYLKFNEIESDFYVAEDEDGKDAFKKDGKVLSTDLTRTFNDENIVAYTSKDWFRRITSKNKNSVLSDINQWAGKNVLNVPALYINSEDYSAAGYSSFLSFKLNSILVPGEHIKVICHPKSPKDTKGNKRYKDAIFEIIISNDESYSDRPYGLSDEIINSYEHTYMRNGGKHKKGIVSHRIGMYVDDNMTVNEQAEALYNAFNTFTDCPFKAVSLNESQIGLAEFYDPIHNEYDYLEFERITSDIIFDTNNYEKLEEDDAEAEKITFFGNYTPYPCVIDPLSKTDGIYQYRKVLEDGSEIDNTNRLAYCPINYEMLGPRLIFVTRFVKLDRGSTTEYDLYEISTNLLTDTILNEKLLYIDNRYSTPKLKEYDKFNLTFVKYDRKTNEFTDVTVGVNVLTSFNNPKLQMIKLERFQENTKLHLSKFNAYEPYRLAYGVCGILSLKDFDFDVRESIPLCFIKDSGDKSEPLYKLWGNGQTKRWTEESLQNYIESQIVTYTEKETSDGYTIREYPKKGFKLTKVNEGDEETENNPSGNKSDYANNLYNRGKRESDISFVCPYTVKWESCGTSKDLTLNFGDDTFLNLFPRILSDKKSKRNDYHPYIQNIRLYKGTEWTEGTIKPNVNPMVPQLYYDKDDANKTIQNGYVKFESIDMSSHFDGKTLRECLLDNSLDIEDIVYNFGNAEKIKAYKLNDSAIEFTHDGIVYKITIQNLDVVNADELNNFNVYKYESEAAGNKQYWELFVDIPKKSILIVHYDKLKIDSSGENIIQNGEKQANWCRLFVPISSDELYINSEAKKMKKIVLDGGYYLEPWDQESAYLGGDDNNEKLYLNFGPEVANDSVMPIGAYIFLHCDEYTIRCKRGQNNEETVNGKRKYYFINPKIYRTVINSVDVSTGTYTEAGQWEDLTNELLDKYCSNRTAFDVYVVKIGTISNSNGGNKLETDGLMNFYLKSYDSYSEYTNTKLFKLDITNGAKKGNSEQSEIQTFYTPVTKDILTFGEFTDGSVSYKNGRFGNFSINGAENLRQLWFNKHAVNANYCFNITQKKGQIADSFSFDYVLGYNTFMNCFDNTYFKHYSFRQSSAGGAKKYSSETLSSAVTGVMNKPFFNTPALLLKNKKVTSLRISNWINSKFENGKMYFNITNSLINDIYNSGSFNKIWTELGIGDSSKKINFIKNSILPHININTENVIDVYFSEGLRDRVSDSKQKKMEPIQNVKATLISSNGYYYVELEPRTDIKGTYFIEYNIKL